MKALAENLLFQISAKANCFDILFHHLKVVAIQKFKCDFPAKRGLERHITQKSPVERYSTGLFN